jgi:glycerol-3-phosphate acyltransferase PlsY
MNNSIQSLLLILLSILIGYALGALPTGYLLLRLIKGQDITKIGSGRTGGTNAMRAGGFGMGLATALLDILKGYLAVVIARSLAPDLIWAHVFAGAASVFGHNWSLWLYFLTGKVSAGAGAGPNSGAATAFWSPMLLLVIPLGIIMVLVVGYASLATISIALLHVIVFSVLYMQGAPWEHIAFALITTLLVVIALRPNIERLMKGTERRVGFFSHKKEGSE